MNEQIEALFEIDYKIVILGIITIMIGIKAFWLLFNWFFHDLLGLETKGMRSRREEHELLITTAESLNQLKDKQDEDTKQSIIHDQRLKQDLEGFSDALKEIKDEVTLMRTQRDHDKLAEYKDKIGQSYRYYKERKYSNEDTTPYWNHMEKEALEGLIKQYESHGGSNSFVHSIVEPEMQTWKLID